VKSDLELMQKVQRIAGHIRHLMPRGAAVDVEDLVQDGMVGMLDAKRLYDRQKSDNFLGFADLRISGAIRDGLRSQDWCGRSARARIKYIWTKTIQLTQELGRTPTSDETAAAANLTLDAVYEAQTMAHRANLVSLSSPIADVECGATIGDAVVDEHSVDAFEIVVQEEHKRLLRDAFRKLNAKERQAMCLYYLDPNEYKLDEVAQFMGLGVSRVSQICTGARKKLETELRKHQEFASCSPLTSGQRNTKRVKPRPRVDRSKKPTTTASSAALPAVGNWFGPTSAV